MFPILVHFWDCGMEIALSRTKNSLTHSRKREHSGFGDYGMRRFIYAWLLWDPLCLFVLENALTMNACAWAISVGDEDKGPLAITRVGGAVILVCAARKLSAGVKHVAPCAATTRVRGDDWRRARVTEQANTEGENEQWLWWRNKMKEPTLRKKRCEMRADGSRSMPFLPNCHGAKQRQHPTPI